MNRDDTPPASTGPVINNHGVVHTASQTGPGYVGAMGDNARGNVHLHGGPSGDAELQEQIAELRNLLKTHRSDLSDAEVVSEAIDDLEEKVDDNAAPDKLRRATKLILRLTNPIQAFVDVITKIHDLIDRLRS